MQISEKEPDASWADDRYGQGQRNGMQHTNGNRALADALLGPSSPTLADTQDDSDRQGARVVNHTETARNAA